MQVLEASALVCGASWGLGIGTLGRLALLPSIEKEKRAGVGGELNRLYFDVHLHRLQLKQGRLVMTSGYPG